jgi:EthD domain
MVKLIICAARKPGMSHEEFSTYWREKHGPLVRSVTEFSRHVRRYLQCHLAKTAVPFGIPGDYDGVADSGLTASTLRRPPFASRSTWRSSVLTSASSSISRSASRS